MPPRQKRTSPVAPPADTAPPGTPAARTTNAQAEDEATIDPGIAMPVDPVPAGGDEPAEGYASEKDDDAPGPIDPIVDGALPRDDPDVVADEEQEPTLEEAEAALGDNVAPAVPTRSAVLTHGFTSFADAAVSAPYGTSQA